MLTDDELTDEITTWAGRVAAGEARLLALGRSPDPHDGLAAGALGSGQGERMNLGGAVSVLVRQAA